MNKLHIDDILSNPALKQLFYEFLSSQHDQESMDCLIAVEDFEHCEDESLQRVAWSLVNKYLMRSSNSMLNLSQRKRNSCLVDIGNHIVSGERAQVFNKLKIQIRIQLQQEKVPLFLKSQTYRDYVDERCGRRKTMDVVSLRAGDDIIGKQLSSEQIKSALKKDRRLSVTLKNFFTYKRGSLPQEQAVTSRTSV